jgi:hypothetical protein
MQAYWIALMAWTGVSVGALGILSIHGLVGGRWGELLGPALYAATRPLWLMGLLFVPVRFHLDELFPWISEQHSSSADAGDPLGYWTVPGFLLRAGVYWAVWLALVIFLPFTSRMVDGARRANSRLSAAALPLIVLTVTFAAIDWMMSLEAHWHSTAYGVIVLAGQGAAAFAISILAAAATLANRPIEPAWAWNDAGNLLLAAISFWMYVTFVQFQIIWSGNLPEEITWYLRRAASPWQEAAVAVVVLHWVVPFVLLLSRDVKRVPSRLAVVAALVLLMHLVDAWWLMAPSFGHATAAAMSCDWLMIATVGALWMFVFTLWPPKWPPREESAPAEHSHGHQ